MADKLMVVIPCYNEEEVLPETSRRLVEKMAELTRKGLISPESRVLLVDDGSRDRTWELISALHKENPLFEGVKLSRNRGHQNALLAGLMTARGRCDMSISMDADLQDDMDAMDRFIEKYREGCDVVYGVRNRRDTDTAFKRGTALMFYLASLVLTPAYERCRSQSAPDCFRGLPAALLTIAVLSMAFLGFTG